MSKSNDFLFIELSNGKTVQAIALVDADGNQVVPSSFISGTVTNYASLPTPASSYTGQVWYVENPSQGNLSFLGVYKYPKGLYSPNSSNDWELIPLNVKVAEDSLMLVNITNWTEFFAYAFDVSVGDKLIYNRIIYTNLTGTMTSTAPDTDTTNWTSNLGVNIASPKANLHVFSAASGGTPGGDAVLLIEGQNNPISLQFLSAITGTQTINFGDTDSSVRGLIQYNHSQDLLTIATTNGGIQIDSNGNIIINEFGNDNNVRVEGDTDENLLFVDGGNDRVGIGVNNPLTKFHINGGVTDKTTRVTAVSYDVIISDKIIYGNTNSNEVAINLQAGTEGRSLRIVNTGNSGNDVVINPNGSENLIGANSSIRLSDGEVLIINYNATDGWY